MSSVRLVLERALSRARLALANLAEGGVDYIIAEFLELDMRLENYIAKRDAELTRIGDEIGRSFDRERRVVDAEAKHRTGLYNRDEDVLRDVVRAQRIREAVRNLIGE